MGSLSWADATADGGIRVDGPRQLARAFPGWAAPTPFAHIEPLIGPLAVNPVP